MSKTSEPRKYNAEGERKVRENKFWDTCEHQKKKEIADQNT